jgi:hypothetical protein
MVRNRVKHLTTGFVLFTMSAILLIVALFGFSRAWFSNTQEKKMTGSIASMSIAVNSPAITPVNNNYTFTPSDIGNSFSTMSVTVTSTINAYVKIYITANWSTLDYINESVFDVLTFTLADGWACLNSDTTQNTSITGGNNIISNGTFYYIGKTSKIEYITSNSPIDLITGISLNNGKEMPANLVLNIYAEAEQANKLGLEKLGFTIS